MRIVAITRVLDEADVIEAFVRHSAAYVQHHIFLDNGSVDGTWEILRSLKQEGIPISVFQTKCVSFNEYPHLTFLFREAVARHASDWVAVLDADEFIDDRLTTSGLADMLSDLPRDVCAVKAPMVEYVTTRDDAASEQVVPVRIRRRREPTDNAKVIVRGDPSRFDVELLPGGHGLKLGQRPGHIHPQTAVRLAHYSERSPFQILAKCVKGWNKVLAAGAATVAAGHSYHYRGPYEALRDDPRHLLRSADYMGFKHDAEMPTLVDDPIRYLGGTLSYTAVGDETMRAVRTLMGTYQLLALRHGALLDAFPEVRQKVAEWDSQMWKML